MGSFHSKVGVRFGRGRGGMWGSMRGLEGESHARGVQVQCMSCSMECMTAQHPTPSEMTTTKDTSVSALHRLGKEVTLNDGTPMPTMGFGV